MGLHVYITVNRANVIKGHAKFRSIRDDDFSGEARVKAEY
jgi:hypothetical protein